MYKRLRDLREDRDLRQSDLAKATGIDQRTISNYETGKTAPDAYALIKLADFFNVSIDYLVGRTKCDLYSSDKRVRYIERIQQELENLKKYPQTNRRNDKMRRFILSSLHYKILVLIKYKLYFLKQSRNFYIFTLVRLTFFAVFSIIVSL